MAGRPFLPIHSCIMAETIRMPRTRAVLEEYGAQVVAEMVTRLRGHGKDATGNLIESLGYEVEETSSELVLSFVMADYGDYVDQGRRPGSFPPVDRIREWCRVRGIPESAAYPISAAIARRGIPPTNFYTVSTTRRQGQLDAKLELAIGEDLEAALQEAGI